MGEAVSRVSGASPNFRTWPREAPESQAGEAFLGLEYFFQKRWSLQVDGGPALISLKDRDSSLSVQGVEYVVNFGINWYFNKR